MSYYKIVCVLLLISISRYLHALGNFNSQKNQPEYQEIIYSNDMRRGTSCILVADIGGRKTNFGIFGFEEKDLKLLVSFHFNTPDITNFIAILTEIVSYTQNTYHIQIKKTGLAVTGVAGGKPVFLPFPNDSRSINEEEILKECGLECLFLVNNFEVAGYGLEDIDKQHFVIINKGYKPAAPTNKAVIGADQWLGKCLYVWCNMLKEYIPVPSEGGEKIFTAQSQEELDLLNYIRSLKPNNHVSWSSVLGKKGIERIYSYLNIKDKQQPLRILNPLQIFERENSDLYSSKTADFYTRLFARCIKEYVLDCLALDGVYIIGNIALQHTWLFQQNCFMEEFASGTLKDLLKDVPVYIVTDNNIGLYGAARYALLKTKLSK